MNNERKELKGIYGNEFDLKKKIKHSKNPLEIINLQRELAGRVINPQKHKRRK